MDTLIQETPQLKDMIQILEENIINIEILYN